MTSRSRLLLVLVWLAGAVVATSIGLLAVRQVASSVGDPAVPVLAAGPSAPPRPATPPPASPTASPVRPASATASFRSAGGAIGAQCTGTTPALLYATPADGYAVDERSVEGTELEVRFEAGERRVELTVDCATGRPVLAERRVDED